MTCNIPLAVILGCAGVTLTDEEQHLFKESNPFGLILFARNCANSDQIKTLISQFRDLIGQQNAPVFIDQEGGRVTRLRPPYWRHPPPAHNFVDLANAKGDDVALKAIRLNSILIAKDLKTMGISVNCAPVLDILVNNAAPVVGDRALGGDVERIGKLGAALCAGLPDRHATRHRWSRAVRPAAHDDPNKRQRPPSSAASRRQRFADSGSQAGCGVDREHPFELQADRFANPEDAQVGPGLQRCGHHLLSAWKTRSSGGFSA